MSEEWIDSTLGRVCDVQVGPAFKSEVFRSAPDGTRLLRGINLGPQGTRWNEVYLWPDERLEEFRRFLLNEADVCIAMDATFTSGGQIRAAQMASTDLPALLVQRVARLRARPDSGLDQGFLALVVGSGTFRGHLSDRQTGAFAPHISAADLKSFPMALPPLPVQRRIVDLMTHLDVHLESLQREVDAVSDLIAFLSSKSEVTERQPLGSRVRARGGKRMPKGVAFADAPTEHPYLRVVDMVDGTFDDSNLEYVPDEVFPAISRYTVAPGDLTISIVGTIGRIAVVPEWAEGANLTENAAIIDILDDCLDKLWLAAWLQTPEGQKEIERVTVGTSQGKLALSRIPLIEVPPLSFSDQQEVANQVQAASALRKDLLKEVSALSCSKSVLLHDLLSGSRDIPASYSSLLTEVA